MPLLGTRGAGSARGFGFFGGSGPLIARVMLLGGGTGGRNGHSLGGQGGGFTDSSDNLLAKGTYTVTVGAGGPGAPAGNNADFGGNSQASSFTGTGVSLTGAAVTDAQGAGANGINARSPNPGTNEKGGNGLTSDITGSSTYYGGGGGSAGGNGFDQTPGGPGGLGGGGLGGKCCSSYTAVAGTNGLGGGGGGGGIQGCGTTYCAGRNGGTGRVIISYPGAAAKATGGTITVSGGIVRHDFQSSGSFVYS